MSKDNKPIKETLAVNIPEEELLSKYDQEYKYRKFSKNSLPQIITSTACIALSLYHLYTAVAGPPTTLIHRTIHTSLLLFLVFLLYPSSKKTLENQPTFLDWVFSFFSLGLSSYIILNYNEIILRSGLPNNTDIIMGIAAVLIVLEASRRILLE